MATHECARHDAAPLSPAPVRVHLALLTVSLFFGANFVLTKELLATVPPAAWVAFRVLSASALLLPIAIWAGRGPVPMRLELRKCQAPVPGFTGTVAVRRSRHGQGVAW